MIQHLRALSVKVDATTLGKCAHRVAHNPVDSDQNVAALFHKVGYVLESNSVHLVRVEHDDVVVQADAVLLNLELGGGRLEVRKLVPRLGEVAKEDAVRRYARHIVENHQRALAANLSMQGHAIRHPRRMAREQKAEANNQQQINHFGSAVVLR